MPFVVHRLRRLRFHLHQSATALWGRGFGFVGRRSKTALREWQSSRGPVLVVAPHPDDECAGCGGAVLRHRTAGDPVVVACITDGRRSRAFGLDAETMATTRRSELESAAQALGGCDVRWLGLPEGQWHDAGDARALDAMVHTLREVDPPRGLRAVANRLSSRAPRRRTASGARP